MNPVVFFTLCAIFVNGFTDAPNAIATCISTRALSTRHATFLSALFNIAGMVIMSLYFDKVAMTITRLVHLDGGERQSLQALFAALLSIVLWALLAWYFGIPTSESHALLASLSGAAIALQGGMSGMNVSEWKRVLFGLFLSVLLGFFGGYLVCKSLQFFCVGKDRRKLLPRFRLGQIFAGCAMSFLHGAQDGQKFVGVLLLSLFLTKSPSVSLPLSTLLFCSLLMGLGTALGGKRIIKSVGMDMARLESYQGFSADLASAFCLLICSLAGIPVSTTHVKTTAILGAGIVKGRSAVNLGVIRDMAYAWLLTFPCCMLLGFLLAQGFLTLS